jgi:clan AA aspartic protease (TIGR02281 family)
MAARQQETLHIADVRSQLDKLSSSRADLITHTLDLSDKAEAAAAKYAALAADAGVADALARLSIPGRTPLKLGPSGLFQEDLQFIRQCRSEIDTATIPVEVQDNVPEVDVRLNDKLTTKMIWDSGATLVTLSYQTAAKIGLVPGDQDQTIQVTLADGSVAKETLMEIDSIRIGTFTVRHIPCEVAPPEAKDSVNLLGDSFQCRFIARMDMANQQVHLTPLGNEPDQGDADKAKSVTAEQP